MSDKEAEDEENELLEKSKNNGRCTRKGSSQDSHSIFTYKPRECLLCIFMIKTKLYTFGSQYHSPLRFKRGA